VTYTNEGGWRRERERYTSGVCFTLEVTEYFIDQLSEAGWLTMARDSTCAEASAIIHIGHFSISHSTVTFELRSELNNTWREICMVICGKGTVVLKYDSAYSLSCVIHIEEFLKVDC
jgi:hypothetical protein